jgi:hypothetical protein
VAGRRRLPVLVAQDAFEPGTARVVGEGGLTETRDARDAQLDLIEADPVGEPPDLGELVVETVVGRVDSLLVGNV